MNPDAQKPPLPPFADLPSIEYLPDPFKKATGTRIITRDEWRSRRAEIRAYLEHYDVGVKPGKPTTFKAALNGDTINITVGEAGKTFEMTASIVPSSRRPGGQADTRHHWHQRAHRQPTPPGVQFARNRDYHFQSQ
jgi:hypothetical protein